MAYTCLRMLGKVSLLHDTKTFCQAEELAPDVLDDDLSADGFRDTFQGRRGAVESALMNQSLVAGIGNVYADEILFQMKLNPQTTLDGLSDEQLGVLYRVSRRSLRVAARREGDTAALPDHYLLPHGEQDGRCPACGHDLEETKVSGRTTRYCPDCQS